MHMKKLLSALFLCLLTATGQQKGHFILGGGPSVIIGTQKASVLMYSLEAGISYNLLESLRLTASLGGFRSVMSFDRNEWTPESANGPMVSLGADYLFLRETKRFRPLVSLSTGYRLRIRPGNVSEGTAVKPVRADGAFLTAALGGDLRIGGLCMGIALTGHLTGSFHPAAGMRLRIMLP